MFEYGFLDTIYQSPECSELEQLHEEILSAAKEYVGGLEKGAIAHMKILSASPEGDNGLIQPTHHIITLSRSNKKMDVSLNQEWKPAPQVTKEWMARRRAVGFSVLKK